MGINCACPVGTAIGDISVESCPFTLGQVQKVIFQRIYETGTTKNKLAVATENPALLATWTALKAAADGSKVAVSPIIANPVTEPGEPILYGGGNETPNGIEVVTGGNPTPFTANLLQKDPKIIKELKAMMCETLGVYLLDEYGRITGIVDDLDAPTELYPIPVYKLFIGDRTLGGREQPDMNALTFSFKYGWGDNLKTYVPTDFHAVEDL